VVVLVEYINVSKKEYEMRKKKKETMKNKSFFFQYARLDALIA
jgi:hypothetical protein